MTDENKNWSQRVGLLVRGSLVTLFFVLVIVSIAALPPILLIDSELLTFADTPLGRFLERATSVGVMVLSVSIFIFLSYHVAAICERAFGRRNAGKPNLNIELKVLLPILVKWGILWAVVVVFIAGLHSLIGWEILEGDDLVFPIMLGLWIWIDEFQIIRRIKPEQE
jgi:formate hydrogenlyase subunit 3/multisubunit Na+/H+ antiporter MnhD subunit